MISLRNEIKNYFVTALKTINIGDGYNTTPQLVQQSIKTPSEVGADKFPALFVVGGKENKQIVDLDGLESTMEVIVAAYIKSDSTQNSEDETDKIAIDIERCICSTLNRFAGGIVTRIVPSSMVTDEGMLKPISEVDITFTITYRHVYGAPQTQD